MGRPGLREHPKFRRLVHILGEPVPHVLGYLECMWLVGYQSGNSRLGDSTDVELAAEWPGERGKLAKALLDCRFVDEVDGAFHIHDLLDNAPEYVKKRHKREEERRAKKKGACPVSVRSVSAEWQPLTSTPSPTPTPAPSRGMNSPRTPSCPEPAEPASGQKSPAEDDGTQTAPKDPDARHGAPSGGHEAGGGLPVLVFPTVGRGPTEWPLGQSKLAEYRDAFPGIDALAECKKALQWCRDHPLKRKTFRGMSAFLWRWLERAQNSNRGGAGSATAKGTESLDDKFKRFFGE